MGPLEYSVGSGSSPASASVCASGASSKAVTATVSSQSGSTRHSDGNDYASSNCESSRCAKFAYKSAGLNPQSQSTTGLRSSAAVSRFQIRSEIALLSYEMGLPTQFIAEFEAAAQNLNVGPTQRLLTKLTWKLCELEWYGRSRHELNDMGASWLADDFGKLLKVGDVQAATEKVLKTMKEWNPDARRYSAQAFGIPESTVLIYDELRRLWRSSPVFREDKDP
jgi:hypothetical protein